MNSYNISYKKGPPSVYPSLIPYNVEQNTKGNLPRLIHVEKRIPREDSPVHADTSRSSQKKDKFYIEWEKQQVTIIDQWNIKFEICYHISLCHVIIFLCFALSPCRWLAWELFDK